MVVKVLEMTITRVVSAKGGDVKYYVGAIGRPPSAVVKVMDTSQLVLTLVAEEPAASGHNADQGGLSVGMDVRSSSARLTP